MVRTALARNERRLAPLRPTQGILPPARSAEPGAYALAMADAGEAGGRKLPPRPGSGRNRSN